VESSLERKISEKKWKAAKSLVDRHGGFSNQVLDAIALALDEV